MAPTVVNRKTGEIISAPVITQEQRDKLWEQYVRSYVRRHPEMFQEPPKEGETAV